ncbi:hypothetical protein BDZ89DRAFT_1146592 [Hymenopellis radicata]|nr:hypothetical protein BDZ89DRAFT_1146592 [Hymenopellis radicata]
MTDLALCPMSRAWDMGIAPVPDTTYSSDNDGKLNRSSPRVRRALGCCNLFCASSSSLPTSLTVLCLHILQPARGPGSTLTLTPSPGCLPPLNIPAITLVPLVPFKTPPITPYIARPHPVKGLPPFANCSGYAEE